MQSIVDMARLLLMTRETVLRAKRMVQEGKRDPLSRDDRHVMMGFIKALAWVLEVDLDQMNAPKVAGVADPLDAVQATWIDTYGCYLVEFPPDEMQAQQQYRAEFLSEKQAQQLLDELRLHVFGRAYLTPAEYEEAVRLDREARRARQRARALEAEKAAARDNQDTWPRSREPVQISDARAARNRMRSNPAQPDAEVEASSGMHSMSSDHDTHGKLPEGA
jgi:hypothetical protein